MQILIFWLIFFLMGTTCSEAKSALSEHSIIFSVSKIYFCRFIFFIILFIQLFIF